MKSFKLVSFGGVINGEFVNGELRSGELKASRAEKFFFTKMVETRQGDYPHHAQHACKE